MSNEIYFTSDMHYGHGNVIKYSNRPFMDQFEQYEYDKAREKLTPAEFREFDRRFKISPETVTRMDEEMIARHNSKVPPNGIVYYVGDVSFHKSVEHTVSILKRLNGTKYLITGNHDKHIIKDPAFRACFGWIRDLTEIKHENQSIVLCHYAMLTWNKSHYKTWMLHGHSHGSLPVDMNTYRMDVGVDCNNFYPWSFSEIREVMSKRNFIAIDHHD